MTRQHVGLVSNDWDHQLSIKHVDAPSGNGAAVTLLRSSIPKIIILIYSLYNIRLFYSS